MRALSACVWPAGSRKSSLAKQRTHRNCSKRSEKDCSTFSRVTFSYKSVIIQAERMVPVMDSIEDSVKQHGKIEIP